MTLKPQDILVALKLVVIGSAPWTYNWLATELGMSAAEVHAAVKRLLTAQLIVKQEKSLLPSLTNLEEFLVFGLRHVFVADWGQVTSGIPTLHGAPPLRDKIAASSSPIPVWPDPDGETEGISFSPLYKSVTKAAKTDPALYELLVLVDGLRAGSSHERALAAAELHHRFYRESATTNEKPHDEPDTLWISNDLSVSHSALSKLAQRYHISRLQLFGSAARGELQPGSDIDLLVEFETDEGPSLWGMVGLQDELSMLFGGRAVDLATPEILENPYRRRTIEPDLKLLIDEAA